MFMGVCICSVKLIGLSSERQVEFFKLERRLNEFKALGNTTKWPKV